MEYWTTVGTAIAGLMIARTMFQEYLPQRFRGLFARFVNRFIGFFSPHIEINFPELTGERLKRSEAYSAIQSYLSAECCASAKRLKADVFKGSQSVILSMDDHEEVPDVFQGIRVIWFSSKTSPKSTSVSFYPSDGERRSFTLMFHKDHRDTITKSYIPHVLEEGKAIAFRNRQRKLYTNNPSSNWYSYKPLKWSHVPFEHPASFDTLAMPSKTKESIKKDLVQFSNGQDYYNRIGKPWKRGYLLYGPPGTGKSTMIAAMANFLSYDVYDLELTTVKDNSELRKLLIETTSKSIIVIEDIDCSLHLTGQRATKEDENEEGDEEGPAAKALKEADKQSKSDCKVTLSGLLNFIDGLWSACGGERIIVFTTNYVEKLDAALIRRGRMDRHIELSYCRYEAFQLLAKNYLGLEKHRLFERIERLLNETEMTPADVAEHLMPKSDEDDAEGCLRDLVEALEAAKIDQTKQKLEGEANVEAPKQSEGTQNEKSEKESAEKVAEEVKVNGVDSIAVEVKTNRAIF